MINSDRIEEDIPFWGSRGRRESSSVEHKQERLKPKERYNCNGLCFPFDSDERNDIPFWGNRGRRDSSSQSSENTLWDERFRRQDDDDEDSPFWGSRGRRDDDIPFWGSRGRRENSLDSKQYLSSSKSPDVEDDEEIPFWGNRGRRRMNKEKSHSLDEPEPFWGSRGKKEKYKFRSTDDEEQIPFWGNRGRRMSGLDSYSNRGDDYDDLDSMSKMKRRELSSSFWANRGRESRLNNLFTGPIRNRIQNMPTTNDLNKEVSKGFHIKPSEQNTVHDDRIYAEEPHYILIERSSRASAEDDPYIITRGKKYSSYFHLPKAVRDRRGAIDDIFKSVQNDPYYIARGKKDSFVKVGNTIMSMQSLNRDKEAVCALVKSVLSKPEGTKTKREVNDSERDRRTILKKLAAQLQQDPYFVSRGKKDASDNEKKIKGFVEQIIEMCY
ncbi:uncharacterized protein LOC123701047 [Colias croceus]|uniref:uncharacterized protein LOC123701047 n=1 Tax=Colias crocea TaxID=72248 RepID=UPI001E27FF0B|nr:uncharacterized protein LOC123701047 [Colias croceus]